MTKREQCRYIREMILETNDEKIKAGLRDWRNHILTGSEMDPRYAQIVFEATVTIYEKSRGK